MNFLCNAMPLEEVNDDDFDVIFLPGGTVLCGILLTAKK